VFGGAFVPRQLKIQTLARSPARTITLPLASTLSDSARHHAAPISFNW
jgi:hypothetical protein